MALEIGKDHPDCTVKIADVEALAKSYDLQGVLVAAIRRDGTIELVTYADHPAQKTAIGDFSEAFGAHGLTKVPFQTMFGWGNGGTPKALNAVEKDIMINQVGWSEERLARATHPDAI